MAPTAEADDVRPPSAHDGLYQDYDDKAVFLPPVDAFGGTPSDVDSGGATMTFDGTVAMVRVSTTGAVEAQVRRKGEPLGAVTTLQPAAAGVEPSVVQVLGAVVPYSQKRGQGAIAAVWDDGTRTASSTGPAPSTTRSGRSRRRR